jgi:hypothetical protein
MEETQEQKTEAMGSGSLSKNKKWIIIAIAVVVLILVARVAFSPERTTERILEQATGDDFDIDVSRDGSMQITGEDGEEMNITTGRGTTLPGDWPDTIPVLPDGNIEYAASVAGEDSEMNHTVAYTTPRSAIEITEFYKEQLATNGWTIETTMATGEGSMITATNDNDEGVVVYIGESDGVTTVNISTQISN